MFSRLNDVGVHWCICVLTPWLISSPTPLLAGLTRSKAWTHSFVNLAAMSMYFGFRSLSCNANCAAYPILFVHVQTCSIFMMRRISPPTNAQSYESKESRWWWWFVSNASHPSFFILFLELFFQPANLLLMHASVQGTILGRVVVI